MLTQINHEHVWHISAFEKLKIEEKLDILTLPFIWTAFKH